MEEIRTCLSGIPKRPTREGIHNDNHPRRCSPRTIFTESLMAECLSDNGSRAVRSAEIIMADGVFAKAQALFELFYINLVNTQEK